MYSGKTKLKQKLVMILVQLESLDKRSARSLKLAQEKGRGAWLTALPLASMGYVLNKQEFRDSMVVLYGCIVWLEDFRYSKFLCLW